MAAGEAARGLVAEQPAPSESETAAGPFSGSFRALDGDPHPVVLTSLFCGCNAFARRGGGEKEAHPSVLDAPVVLLVYKF